MARVLNKCCRFRRRVIFRSFTNYSSSLGYVGNESKNTPNNVFDVVISGGGMVGACMAAALGCEPLFERKKVLLLEGGEKPEAWKRTEKYKSRTCALSPATANLLTGLGAWENMQNMRLQEVKRMQVWDSCSDSMIAFNREDLTENLAYIAENDVILDAITQQLEKAADAVEVRYKAKVKSYRMAGDSCGDKRHADNPWVQVHLDNGETIQTRLLIGADGHKSLVRQSAAIHSVNWEYKQNALVATLHLTEDCENNVAWQRFLPTGPIAMLPVSEDRSCLIWTTTSENGKNLLQLSEESFVDAVNSAFWSDDKKNSVAQTISRTFDEFLTSVGFDGSTSKQLPPTVIGVDGESRAMFPLGLGHATHYVKPRVALIGDAAHRCHPLAGQGVNLGFADVACLRDILVSAVSEGGDIGAMVYLTEYETLRQRKVLPTLATVDGLNRLYSNELMPFVLLRTLGLQATNACSPLKKQIIQLATS